MKLDEKTINELFERALKGHAVLDEEAEQLKFNYLHPHYVKCESWGLNEIQTLKYCCAMLQSHLNVVATSKMNTLSGVK